VADSSLALVQETFTLLTQTFFRPLNSKQLLTTAWSAAAAEARLEGSHANVAAPALTGDSANDLAAFSRQYLQLVGGLSGDHAQVAFSAAQAMTASLHERHTYFLNPQEAKQFTEQSSGQTGLVGIGVTIATSRPPFLISDVVPGGPAQRAGVQLGDEILSVDGSAMANATQDKLSATIRGQAGSTVRLGLKRPNGSTVEVTITRAQVLEPILESRMLAQGVCYLRLHNFPFADQLLPDGKTVIQELDADLQACEQAHVVGWVLDLRGNPGGADVARFAAPFIGDGVLSTSRDRLGATYQMAPEGPLFPDQHPLAVLVDGGSASSSEILASAVQDLHRGIVVGAHSAAVVNATELIPLPLGAELGVAVEQVLRGANGPPLDGTGVTPDIAVNPQQPTAAQLAAGSDNQIDKAAQSVITAAQKPVATPAPIVADPNLLSDQAISSRFGPLLLPESAVPTQGASKRADILVDTVDGYASESPNLEQAKARAVRLGFEGAILHRYGPADSPTYTISIAAYTGPAGAHDDLARVYQPGEVQNPPEDYPVIPPLTLGDETVARVGIGPNTGAVELAWRRGGVLLDIAHNGNPGDVPLAEMASLAKAIDARYAP